MPVWGIIIVLRVAWSTTRLMVFQIAASGKDFASASTAAAESNPSPGYRYRTAF